ncbi:hypothetical protein A3K70_00845 [Candidatus Bathyarchaeota archaeon RBG_16_48_13]|nr:MAG: hypothetical protein A3K70_00845 [Candidatus Bathyarchaeota archaeon RBG_16_48_13]
MEIEYLFIDKKFCLIDLDSSLVQKELPARPTTTSSFPYFSFSFSHSHSLIAKTNTKRSTVKRSIPKKDEVEVAVE